MNYLNLFQYIISTPIYPHYYCASVQEIPFQKLKQIGVKCLLFDRDNTLTKHLETKTVYEELLSKLKKDFDQVLLVSNSKINEHTQLGLSVAKTTSKKPFNFQEIQKNHIDKNIKSHQICVIGDRLFTDMVLAHKNGLIGILVKPIDISNEDYSIRLMRIFENFIMRNNQLQKHSYHGNLNF
ncbi:unnamed protein product [Paramecium pentaurelia]|uniref:Uncharacterized protein n=1 Tax=Paramecium pentaurelia TaxID=43138 RepID=A0A8S1WVZ9_9CILI|nr:unnamed protein product [Paramecium pentaurelia]